MKTGNSVQLRDDVLQRHARSIPAHMGYTTEQFRWRDTLRVLKGEVGVITRVFPNSKNANVQFADHLIGISITELVPAAVSIS